MNLVLAQPIPSTAQDLQPVSEDNVHTSIVLDRVSSVTGASTEALIEDWAIKLRTVCLADKERNMQSIMAKSRLFHAAKASLAHGGWARMWREKAQHGLPHTLRTGDKYALIGQEFGEANWKYTSSLPACVDTLFFLAQIGKPLVDELITKGEVDSDLSKGKAEVLRNRYRPDLRPKPKPFNFQRWLCYLRGHLKQLDLQSVPEQIEVTVEELQGATLHLEERLNQLLHEKSLSE